MEDRNKEFPPIESNPTDAVVQSRYDQYAKMAVKHDVPPDFSPEPVYPEVGAGEVQSELTDRDFDPNVSPVPGNAEAVGDESISIDRHTGPKVDQSIAPEIDQVGRYLRADQYANKQGSDAERRVDVEAVQGRMAQEASDQAGVYDTESTAPAVEQSESDEKPEYIAGEHPDIEHKFLNYEQRHAAIESAIENKVGTFSLSGPEELKKVLGENNHYLAAVEMARDGETGEFLLETGAKIKINGSGQFVLSGYAAGGADIKPYLEKLLD